ncbi:MAG: hypothetical protein AAB434_09655 [Planctomycetota bacterium]
MTLSSSVLESHSNRRGGVLKGCLIVAAILVVLAACAGVYVALKWKSWAADAARAAVRDSVEGSQLSEDQKKRVIARIDRFADDFESGKVSIEQVTKVFEEIASGPLLPLTMVYAAKEKYIKPSALSADEKAAGTRSLERVARGVYEKKIPQSALEELTAPISTTNAQGQKQLKETLTTEELNAFLAAAKKKADDAGMPDEAFTVDIATEIENAIDKATGAAPSGK